MFYELIEMVKAASQPLNNWAQASKTLLDNEQIKNHPFGGFASASLEMIERSTRYFKRPDFGLKTCQTTYKKKKIEADVNEELVLQLPFCDLLAFRRTYEGQPIREGDKRVLIIAPMSGHFSTLLRDTVAAMLPQYHVFITDWKDCKMIPLHTGEFHLEDSVKHIVDILKFMGRDTHVLAVCQPAVPLMIAVSVLAESDDSAQPLSMTLMGGPIDTRINPGAINKFAQKHPLSWFEKNVISSVPAMYPGAGRRVYPGFISLGNFISMNSVSHQDAHYQHFLNLVRGDDDSSEKHRKFYDEYLAVMDLPADYFLESVYHVFQNFTLAKGEMTFGGDIIKPEAIVKTALLTIEGERDDISCPGQTKPAHNLCKNIPKSIKEHHLQTEAGHYGIFSGSRWRNQVLPEINKFIDRASHYFAS